MQQTETLLRLYGTSEPLQDLRQVTVGPLSFYFAQEGLRRICWHGTEMVRALAWPIRDENWGTYPVEILKENIDDGDAFEAHLTFAVDQGRLVCSLVLRASGAGEVLADMTMTPTDGPFRTNRAGFTVLHPIAGVAGAPLQVAHSDGTTQDRSFPSHIQPDQPVKDICGLRYGVQGQDVDVVFGGEIFEMEDQRNWTDASFKTYCVPLVHPFTYEIIEPTHQSVRMTFTGDAATSSVSAGQAPLRMEPLGQSTPDIGLALETGWVANSAVLAQDAAYVLLRTSPHAGDLEGLIAFARNYRAVDLEVVVPNDMSVDHGLRAVADALASQSISPRHVIALREAYLGSHQPVGPWPGGPTPNDMLDTVRAAFPKTSVGGGMMTNFTELNRYRPDVERCDFVTHALTPLVHAGDDMSVLETLEALPQIFASTEVLAPGLPYRLGLASIGMRSNPYGEDVAENPNQVRRTMARIDPRHRALFGAAYATGVLAATQGRRVESICLGAPVGPFGLVYQAADYQQLGYDGSAAIVYPLFQVVRAACAIAGKPRLALKGLPDGVVGYGAEVNGTARLILANVTREVQQVFLGGAASILTLDTLSFDAATISADWLDTAPRSNATDLHLMPFAVAFLDVEMSENWTKK